MTSWIKKTLQKMTGIALASPHTFFSNDGQIKKASDQLVDDETETGYLQRHEVLIQMNMNERATYVIKFMLAFYASLSPMGRMLVLIGLLFGIFIMLPALIAVILTVASSRTETIRMFTMLIIYIITAVVWWVASF